MSRVSSGTVTVGTTSVQIDGNTVQPCHIHIRNNENTKTLFVGNSDVTANNGLAIDPLTTIDFDLPPNESIHMVSSSGNHSVSWLRITQ